MNKTTTIEFSEAIKNEGLINFVSKNASLIEHIRNYWLSKIDPLIDFEDAKRRASSNGFISFCFAGIVTCVILLILRYTTDQNMNDGIGTLLIIFTTVITILISFSISAWFTKYIAAKKILEDEVIEYNQKMSDLELKIAKLDTDKVFYLESACDFLRNSVSRSLSGELKNLQNKAQEFYEKPNQILKKDLENAKAIQDKIKADKNHSADLQQINLIIEEIKLRLKENQNQFADLDSKIMQAQKATSAIDDLINKLEASKQIFKDKLETQKDIESLTNKFLLGEYQSVLANSAYQEMDNSINEVIDKIRQTLEQVVICYNEVTGKQLKASDLNLQLVA